MKKFTAVFLFLFCNFYTTLTFAEKALTVKQQLDRLMQEVSDLNKAVFNKSFDNKDLNKVNKEVGSFSRVSLHVVSVVRSDIFSRF